MNNAELNVRIDELWTQTKRGELPRADRFKAVESLTEGYVQNTGKRPPTQALDRLATLCLYEEVTDDTPWKTRNTERPIHSERQRRTIEDNEAGSKPLEYIDKDGHSAGKPTRRR